MAPKAEKQPAKKSVSKVGGAKSGRKKGSKKAIESYKIYIYKVGVLTHECVVKKRKFKHGNPALRSSAASVGPLAFCLPQHKHIPY